MKMKEIHIYGFGKLSDLQLFFTKEMQVIYGENEAGKSTLMAFIHGILFGFPTKQQSELRYEPRKTSKYGGSITIETDEHGEIWIERVHGKAIGDVTVKTANGMVGGEKLLKEVLNSMDKALYKSIFSFDIHGLQGLNLLKGDEIGRYLLAAGTIGADTLLKSDIQLQKEMDRLFKSSGRKPKINEMLQEIKEKEKELKKSMQHNQEYENLQLEYQNLTSEFNRIQQLIAKTKKQLYKLEQYKQEWPLFQERKQIVQRVEELGNISFPVDGINRIEKLEEQIRIATNQLQLLDVRKRAYEKEMEKVSPSEWIENHEEKIQLLIEKWPQVLQWQEEIIRLKEESTKWSEQISKLIREVHFQNNELDDLLLLDLSIDMKERIRTTIKDYFYLKSQQAELNKQVDLENRKLNDLEKQCERIESELLSEEEFRRLMEQQQKYNSLQNEFEKHQKHIEFIHLSNSTKPKENYLTTILFYLLFIGFFIWSFTAGEYFITLGALLGMMALSYSVWTNRKKGNKNNDQQGKELREKIESILVEMNQLKDTKWLYDEQQKRRQEWKGIVLQIENQQTRCKEREFDLLTWKDEWEKVELDINNLKQQLKLQQSFSPEQLQDAFEILSELTKLVSSRSRTVNQLEMLLQKVSEWENELREELNALQFKGVSNEEGVIYLRNALKKEQDNRLVFREIKNKNEELALEHLKWKNDLHSLELKVQQLIDEAHVEDPEAFRKKGKEYEELLSLNANLNMINKKINNENNDVMNSFQSLQDIENQGEILQAELSKHSKLLDNYQKKLAQIKYEIGVLEEGGIYTEKLHEFYHLKSIFNEKAREWAKIALAKEMIHRTMDRMKNERFPKVLEKAEEYLRTLTDGIYIRLLFQPSGQFIVERNDHMMFDPEELSQATTEQIYVSLRLALVQILQDEYPFPIIIDDGFVNFDHDRTRRIIRILLDISQHTQILFFTCHQHLLELFPQNQILMLNEEQSSSMVK